MGEFPFTDDEIENNYLDAKLARLPSLFPIGTGSTKKTDIGLVEKRSS